MLSPDLILRLSVVSILIPDTDDVFIVTDAHHSPTDLMTNIKLLTNDSQHQLLPISGGQSLLQADHPFAPSLILRIFPSWFDSVLEEVIVCGGFELIRSLEMIVYSPEMLHLNEEKVREREIERRRQREGP
jgi:hypothetical protein